MPLHAIKTKVRVEIQLHSYFSLELEGDECLTGSFTPPPRGRSSDTKRVGHRTSQDTTQKTKTLTLAEIEI